MTTLWQPGTTYAKGATVIPTASAMGRAVAPANAGFSDGLTGWNARPGWSAQRHGGYNGGRCAALTRNAGAAIRMVNTHLVAVAPSDVLNATCMVRQSRDEETGNASAQVLVVWYDANRDELSASAGNTITDYNGGAWQKSKVAATAPASAAFAAIGVTGSNTEGTAVLLVDEFSWDYANSTPPALIFTATQDDPAKSGATEPTWPTTVGASVVDGGVTWTGSTMPSVTWTASQLVKSGATEPTWPTTVGASVVDGGVTWVCVTPQVTDPNCPASPHVVIASSKVYAADKDTIRFSATVNPTDWTAEADAGFLPFGLQTYGANPIEAMGLYRSNLVAFNTEGFQMWQVDEDPANSSLLDALPIGSSEHKALSPVSNDLFFLSPQGVRSMGIAAGTANLQAGDVGMPIDPLVQAAMANALARGRPPLATYYPGAGQYWLAFNEDDVFF